MVQLPLHCPGNGAAVSRKPNWPLKVAPVAGRGIFSTGNPVCIVVPSGSPDGPQRRTPSLVSVLLPLCVITLTGNSLFTNTSYMYGWVWILINKPAPAFGFRGVDDPSI